MAAFLARRLAAAIGLLLALSVLVYFLLDIALDPLDDLRASTAPNRDELMAARVRQLGLDRPWFERYLRWLFALLRGDLGVAWRTGQPVGQLLAGAIGATVQLVFAATVLALVLGVLVGLISALRQYSAFDYALTLASFVLYALPVFWVAVLLKQFVAIGLNDYLADPQVNWPALAAGSVLAGAFWAGAIGARFPRQLVIFAVATAVTFVAATYVLLSGWLLSPRLGIAGVGLVGLAAAIAVTATFAGLANKRAGYAALSTVAAGVLGYLPLQWLFDYLPMNAWWLALLAGLAVGVGAAIGGFWGGPDRAVSMRGAALVAVLISVAIYVDRVLQGWDAYLNSALIGRRPIATVGGATPGLGGDFWIQELDRWTHLLLPTTALVLISFASYTRYQRGSMLEVLGEDYIRTARAKGLPNRVVIVRHAWRNALLPLASVVPVDFITLIGGAVITETIFGWSGMGRLFVGSLDGSEIDPVMAYVMIVGGLAMLANLLADLAYGLLDPRVRTTA